MKKIAVIGSGFFGCTIALFLSKKYQVEIFEKDNNIDAEFCIKLLAQICKKVTAFKL